MSKNLTVKFQERGKSEFVEEIKTTYTDSQAIKEVRQIVKLAEAFERNVSNFLFKFAIFATAKSGSVSTEPLNILIRELPKSAKRKALIRFIESHFSCKWENKDSKTKFWFTQNWIDGVDADSILVNSWWVKPSKDEAEGKATASLEKLLKDIEAKLEKLKTAVSADDGKVDAIQNAIISLKLVR